MEQNDATTSAVKRPHDADDDGKDASSSIMKKSKIANKESDRPKYEEIQLIRRMVDIDELDEDLRKYDYEGCFDENEEDEVDDPIEVSLWPIRVVNELNIDGIPSRQQLFDRSFKRLPLLSTIHVVLMLVPCTIFFSIDILHTYQLL
jgi:hypothetical protein